MVDVDELVLVADDSGRFVDATEGALALLGYSRAELLELSIWDLTPGMAMIDGLLLWQAFVRAGDQSGEYALRTRSGRVVRLGYEATVDPAGHRHISRLHRLP